MAIFSWRDWPAVVGRAQVRVLMGAMLWAASSGWAAERARVEESYALHTRAVELGRSGQYRQSLDLLKSLRERFPSEYPIQRDYLLIAAWAGECATVAAEFRAIPEQALESYVISPVRECAVRRAREGKTQEALSMLRRLERDAPTDYPLRRDIVVITIWSGDCETAIGRFERFSRSDRVEPYVATAVTNCLLKVRRPQEALTLARTMASEYPDNEPLRLAYLRAEVAWRLQGKNDNEWREIDARLARAQPERGVREWLAEITASAPFADRWRGYVRYLDSRVSDVALVAGELQRVALGVRYTPTEQWTLSAERSDDIDNASPAGYAVSVNWRPRETMEYWLTYTSVSTESPIRGRVDGIFSDGLQLGAALRTLDYRWEGRLVAAQYDFTDGNHRENVYANVGYAYEMRPDREQRVILEGYQSDNSLAGTVYFNPANDSSMGIAHRTSFVYETRMLRHVDHLQVWVNVYRQAGFADGQRRGIRYEQQYDIDERNAFAWSAGWARNVYDGEPENEIRLDARYRWRF